jgi:hypothetical protein
MSALPQREVKRDGQILPFPSAAPGHEAGAVRVELICDGHWIRLHADLHSGPGVTCQISTDAYCVSAKVARQGREDGLNDSLPFRLT